MARLPERPVTLVDIAEVLQAMGVVCSNRMLDDGTREEPDMPLGKPMAVIGRTRVWDPGTVDLDALAHWFNTAPARRAQRASETMIAQKAAQRAAFERQQADMQRAIAQSKDAAETRAWAQEQRAKREAADAKARKERMDLGTRLVNQNAGSR